MPANTRRQKCFAEMQSRDVELVEKCLRRSMTDAVASPYKPTCCASGERELQTTTARDFDSFEDLRELEMNYLVQLKGVN